MSSGVSACIHNAAQLSEEYFCPSGARRWKIGCLGPPRLAPPLLAFSEAARGSGSRRTFHATWLNARENSRSVQDSDTCKPDLEPRNLRTNGFNGKQNRKIEFADAGSKLQYPEKLSDIGRVHGEAVVGKIDCKTQDNGRLALKQRRMTANEKLEVPRKPRQSTSAKGRHSARRSHTSRWSFVPIDGMPAAAMCSKWNANHTLASRGSTYLQIQHPELPHSKTSSKACLWPGCSAPK